MSSTKKPKRPAPSAELDAPTGLRVITFKDGPARYLMLSYPLDGAKDFPRLTTAEREVLECLLDGLTNAAIAKKRGTSARTVANQVTTLFDKFGATSRLDLARRASIVLEERSDQAPGSSK